MKINLLSEQNEYLAEATLSNEDNQQQINDLANQVTRLTTEDENSKRVIEGLKAELEKLKGRRRSRNTSMESDHKSPKQNNSVNISAEEYKTILESNQRLQNIVHRHR
eukprot:UN04584